MKYLCKIKISTYDVVFSLLFIIGLGLCVAGVWIPPLLVPGGVFIAGALAMFASAYPLDGFKDAETPRL